MNAKKEHCAITAADIKAKYGRKRFNSETIGKAHLLNYLYWTYLLKEGKTNEELSDTPLYKNLDEMIQKKLFIFKDVEIYRNYVNLEDWIQNEIKTASCICEAVQHQLTYLNDTAGNIIIAEELKTRLYSNPDNKDEDTEKLFSILTLDSMLPDGARYYNTMVIREAIEDGMKYFTLFNTFIELLAEELDIPELLIFKKDLTPVVKLIPNIRKILALARGYVESSNYTEDVKEALRKAFKDIPAAEAPPIPSKNIERAREAIGDCIHEGLDTWESPYNLLNRNYWKK